MSALALLLSLLIVPTDAELVAAVEGALRRSDAVAADRVTVAAEDGVVRLSGSVGHLLAKREARRIVQGLRGVRGVVDLVEVEPPERPDAEIAADVRDALADDAATERFGLDVSVADGRVVLIGAVQSRAEKRLVGRAVAGVRGVREVDNRLAFEPPPARSDFDILTDVEGRLAASIRLDAGGIDVAVDDGHVTLTGAVGSALEADEAERLAWVTGVRGVDVRLTVEPDADRARFRRAHDALGRDDARVRDAIRQAFTLDPRVSADAIDVRVRAGVATLTGVVDTLAARRAAERDAEETRGIARVENRLRVRPSERPADEEVAAAVRRTLARDPYLAGREIEVGVVHGRVTLDGTVTSRFERELAEARASAPAGVTGVTNRLRLDRDVLPLADAVLADEIREELRWSPFVDAGAVTVSVAAGVATLTGSVSSAFERAKAAENAREGGARRVRNLLEVAGG